MRKYGRSKVAMSGSVIGVYTYKVAGSVNWVEVRKQCQVVSIGYTHIR